MTDTILSLQGITVRFGGLTAASNVSIEVAREKIAAVIGPNGAGKTTVFNCVTGVYAPSEGRVFLDGEDLKPKWSRRVVVKSIGIGLLFGILSVIGVNVQTLWDTAINQNYIWGRPFPWGSVIPSIASTLTSLVLSRSLLPFFVGILLGTASSLTLWSRSRHSPMISVRSGIARTFQNIRLFKSMTVLENVLVGMQLNYRPSMLSVILGSKRYRESENDLKRKASELLGFVGLNGCEDLPAASLSYGLQRKLEIARALGTRPALILLDEPAAGMNPSEMEDLAALIGNIRAHGITVLLIEHHMKLVMGISDHITVLEYGEKIAEGEPSTVQRDPRVIAAYLGASTDDQ